MITSAQAAARPGLVGLNDFLISRLKPVPGPAWARPLHVVHLGRGLPEGQRDEFFQGGVRDTLWFLEKMEGALQANGDGGYGGVLTLVEAGPVFAAPRVVGRELMEEAASMQCHVNYCIGPRPLPSSHNLAHLVVSTDTGIAWQDSALRDYLRDGIIAGGLAVLPVGNRAMHIAALLDQVGRDCFESVGVVVESPFETPPADTRTNALVLRRR